MFSVQKGDFQHVYFKYNQDEEFRTIQVTRQKRRSSRIHEHDLIPKYSGPLKIKLQKLKDLMDLC